MHFLAFITLSVTGFVSCAEFGSYAFVHPVLRKLPPTERIIVEQGLLKTFGRIMPIGMPLCLVLAITAGSRGIGDEPLTWSAVAIFAAALGFTIVVNVPINLATGRWDPEHPPPDWEAPGPAGSSSRECAHGCSSSASCSSVQQSRPEAGWP